MKNIYCMLLLFLVSSYVLNAQNNVGIGTLTPNNNALLDLNSNNKGLLIPRLNTAERTGIIGLGANEESLLVFDTDLDLFFYWDGTQWLGFPLDNNASNELQDLVLQNDSILLSNGTGVDLSVYTSGSDDQNLTNATLDTANILTIDIENGSSASVDLSNLSSGSNSNDHDWYRVGSSNAPSSINDNIFTNGKANIGLNADNRYSLNVYRNLQIGSSFGNSGPPTAFGLVVGDTNNVSFLEPGLVAGFSNSVFGRGRYIFGDNNLLTSTSRTQSMIIGKKDTLISNASENIAFIMGKENFIQSFDNNNVSSIIGKENRIDVSGNDRYLNIEGEFNSITSSNASNFFATLNGKDNILEFFGAGNSAFVQGKENEITNPESIFVIGSRNNAMSSNSGFIIGNDILFRNNATDNVAIGEDLLISFGSDRNILIGRNASTIFSGVMMLTDGYTGPTILTSNSANSMTTRFAGGYRLFTDHALSSGVSLAAGGGAWANISDRNKKENFESIDENYVLKSIANFKIYNWNYISQNDEIRHIGPFAQDFYEAFKLGTSNTSIVTSDISGVNMVAIQALYYKNESLEKEVALLKSQQEEYFERLKALEELLLNN